MDTRCRKVYCNCGTPVAELRDGVLIIRVKHHGEEHETRIILAVVDNKKIIMVA